MAENPTVNPAELEIHRALREAQAKYTYFLLATAGAGIAFAVNQTRSLALAPPQSLLAAAVLCWGVSFYLGCARATAVADSLRTNADLYRIEGGRHPGVGPDPQAIPVALCATYANFEKHSNRAGATMAWQFRTLLAGAAFFIAWHIVEMYVRAGGTR